MSELPSSQAGSVSEADLYEDWSAHPIKVGEFIINFNERYAEAPDGEKRNITPNSIKLLLLLLHNSSSYVSLSDIHKFVYGNQYKDDSSTRKQVTSLRKLFDDTAKEKHYIENKLGHGYRLIAPVEFIDEDSVKEHSFETFTKFPLTKISWSLIILLVPIVALSFYFVFNQHESGIDSKSVGYLFEKPTPITHLKGLEVYPSLSPDEKWLLFNHRADGEKIWKIYVRDMVNGDLINLTRTTHTERMPRWVSNTQVVYSQFDDKQCFFYSATFDRNERKLIDEKKLVECSLYSKNAHGAFWPDKQGMFFNRAESINAPFIIYSHSFLTSESWPIASPPPSGKGDYYFSLSDDGSRLAVLRNKNWSQTEVWIYNTVTWETHLVDTIDSILASVSWADDSKAIVYKNSANQIIRYNLSNKVSAVLAQPSIPITAPILKKNGKLLFAAGGFYKKDLYKQTLADNEVESIESSSYQDFIPAVSKSGKKIAWVSNRTGVFQVWYKANEDPPKQITHLVNNLQFVDLSFSPDGSMLGGTASGRWFIIDLSNMKVKWDSGKEYYKNFQWRKNGVEAYVAMKHMEQWEQMILNVSTSNIRASNISEDAFIVLEDHFDNLTYIASFKKEGFWRIREGKPAESQFISTPEVINRTGRWVVTNDGLLFTANKKLFLLEKQKTYAQEIDLQLKGKHIAAPGSGKWVLTSEMVRGEIDLMQF